MSKAEKPLELPKKVEASDVSNDRSIPSPVRSGVQPVKVSEPKKLDQADTDTEQKQSEPVQKPPVLETTIAAPSLVIKTEKRSRIDNEQEQIPTQERSEISGMNKLEKASQQDRSDKSPGQKQPAQKPLGVTAKAEPPLIKTDPKVKVQIKAEPPLIKTEPKVQIKAEPQIEVPKKQQKRLRPARDPEMELKIVKYGEKIEQMGQYLSELDLCVLATGRGVKDDDVPAVPEEEDDGERPLVVREKTRRRCAKRKKKSNDELKMIALRKYLAKIGVSYGGWMAAHWQQSKSKKAGSCPDGKYTDLQKKLVLSQAERPNDVTCLACKTLLSSCNFSEVDAMSFMEDGKTDNVDQDDAQEVEAEEEIADEKDDAQDEGEEREDLSMHALARSVSIYFEAWSTELDWEQPASSPALSTSPVLRASDPPSSTPKMSRASTGGPSQRGQVPEFQLHELSSEP
eukprot:g6500.t1